MMIAIPVFAGETSCSINTAYLNYVKSAGYEPATFSQFNDIEAIASECDGLLLPGGIDVEPTFYGDSNYGSHNCKPEKDDFERRAFRAFLAEGKKIFGICRGFQLMVREFIKENEEACKFTAFYQHVNSHTLASDRNALRSTPTHSVDAQVDKLYGAAKKKGRMFVNSIHHQALVANKKNVDVHVNANNSMVATATTSFGAPTSPTNLLVVEAVDIKFNNVLVRGVQWHPEELLDVALLNIFFDEEQNVVPDQQEHIV